MDVPTFVENSTTYRILLALRGWWRNSFVRSLFGDERVLFAGLALFVLLSLGRILSSGMHVTVKFLSFLVFFLVLLVLVWRFTEPLPDR